ncbi:hypothetical protein EYS14_03555 [Alteromonadaceae bacterium M269]|nr:hypothetical protein EYS14_03555 [Alteromonadaceae bacterium M269]
MKKFIRLTAIGFLTLVFASVGLATEESEKVDEKSLVCSLFPLVCSQVQSSGGNGGGKQPPAVENESL